jgi:uncharacterized protein GlcG (DUF336 family)
VAIGDDRAAVRAYAEDDGNQMLRFKIASGKAYGVAAFGHEAWPRAPLRMTPATRARW